MLIQILSSRMSKLLYSHNQSYYISLFFFFSCPVLERKKVILILRWFILVLVLSENFCFLFLD